ncbi:MAG: membrane protein insertion efficiency factor YidD [bacterium]|nr:membrane protein insertion efficiency factor YidD [bacterium]
MERVIIAGIKFYQSFISYPLSILVGGTSGCRFTPTCSEYAVSCLRNFGVAKGGVMAITRLLSCQPFSRQRRDQGKPFTVSHSK